MSLNELIYELMIPSDEPMTIDDLTAPNVIDGLDRLRKEVDRLKEQLSEISRPSPSTSKEMSYKVTQEITMKSEPSSFLSISSDHQSLVKTFLAHPDNWILFILSSKQALSHEHIRNILGIPVEKRMDLHKRLNDFVDRRILKVEVKIYKIQEFIRFNPKGVIDYERSKELIHDIASASSFLGNHNILIDMTDTTIDLKDMNDIMEIAIESARFKPFVKSKIAYIIPNI